MLIVSIVGMFGWPGKEGIDALLENGRGVTVLVADCQSARERGSDSILMQFAPTVSGESVGNRHHGSCDYACSVRARH